MHKQNDTCSTVACSLVLGSISRLSKIIPHFPTCFTNCAGSITRTMQDTATCNISHFLTPKLEAKNPANRKTQKATRGAEKAPLTLKQVCCQNGSAICVQKLNDSRGLAIRITYRISLRSSSLWEPRHPLLKVVKMFHFQDPI